MALAVDMGSNTNWGFDAVALLEAMALFKNLRYVYSPKLDDGELFGALARFRLIFFDDASLSSHKNVRLT